MRQLITYFIKLWHAQTFRLGFDTSWTYAWKLFDMLYLVLEYYILLFSLT